MKDVAAAADVPAAGHVSGPRGLLVCVPVVVAAAFLLQRGVTALAAAVTLAALAALASALVSPVAFLPEAALCAWSLVWLRQGVVSWCVNVRLTEKASSHTFNAAQTELNLPPKHVIFL